MYGWLTEGGVARTLYGTEDSSPWPLSLLCTGVSWHALISVMVGWYLARRVLEANRGWRTLGLAVGIGVFWGLWAPIFWDETPPVIAPTWWFLCSGCITTTLLVLSYWASGRLGRRGFRPTWYGLTIATLLLALFYVPHVQALGVRPLIVLPLLLLAGCAVLMWSRATSAPTEPEAATATRCGAGNYLLLMAAPVVATGVYALAQWAGPSWPKVHQGLWLASIWLGGALLALSIALIVRGPGRGVRDVAAE
jgi:hypothetical protein